VSRIGLWLTLLGLLLLAGCGGSDQTAPQAPAIPRAVAEDLAGRAEAIADTLQSGDECGAAHEADDLVAAVATAVESGQIPAELQDSLTETAVELQNEINCPPPKEKDEDEKDDEKGKDKGNGNGDGNGGGDETTTLLDTPLDGEG
jgi:hypothetical protein